MSEEMIFTVWVTKYALSRGLYEEEVKGTNQVGEFVRPTDRSWFAHFKIGKDAFLSKEEAVEAAKKTRDKKISSLSKQILKLQAMEFE